METLALADWHSRHSPLGWRIISSRRCDFVPDWMGTKEVDEVVIFVFFLVLGPICLLLTLWVCILGCSHLFQSRRWLGIPLLLTLWICILGCFHLFRNKLCLATTWIWILLDIPIPIHCRRLLDVKYDLLSKLYSWEFVCDAIGAIICRNSHSYYTIGCFGTSWIQWVICQWWQWWPIA